jgi:acyl-CoA synthetase (NDP forming)
VPRLQAGHPEHIQDTEMKSERFRDLSPLLKPRSIAVVGASERPGSPGRQVLENLRALGYAGSVFPVHPRHDEVLGWPCFPDLGSLPGPVDLVAVMLAAGKVLPVLEAAAQQGTGAAWVFGSGFAEAGPEGQVLQEELARFARNSGMLIIGPNCVGMANLVDRAAAYSAALGPATKPGHVSAIVQSGAICLGLANAARFGFRFLISSGNEAVLDSADFVHHLVADPHTRVIIAFLEGIKSPARFTAAARAAAEADKPILLVKVGRSEAGRRAVQAHTGSLAGSDAVVEAVFRHLGVVRLESLDELVEATELFLKCPRPAGDGVGLLSLSGGLIGLAADIAQDLGLQFPEFSEDGRRRLAQILPSYSPIANPLDAWGSGDLEQSYPACVEVVGREPDVHLLAVTRDAPPQVAPLEVRQSLAVARASVGAAEETGKPVVVFSNLSAGFHPQVQQVLQEANIPYLQGTRNALRAIRAFFDYGRFRRRVDTRTEIAWSSPASLGEWRERLARDEISEVEGRRLLAAYGIRGPREVIVANEREAVSAADELGYPVVVKTLAFGIQHKTEIGGVQVGLQGEADVRRAFREVTKAAQEHLGGSAERALVQEMVCGDAVEVILGVLNDPGFGPVVLFGSGGVLVELIRDSVLRLPPLDREMALEMIGETRGASLLQGFRGRPAADVDALADALVRLSHLAVDLGDLIAAVDINPLMVLPKGQGVRAVDVLIETAV